MIDLRSDTLTKPTPEMLETILDAPLGDDDRTHELGRGEDPTVNELEDLAAQITGKQAAVLMPSGSMANTAAVLAQAKPGSTLLVDDAVFAAAVDVVHRAVGDALHAARALECERTVRVDRDDAQGVVERARQALIDIRFGDVAKHRKLEGVYGVFGVRGDEDDLGIGKMGLDLRGEVHAVDVRHLDVEKQQVEMGPVLDDVIQERVAARIGNHVGLEVQARCAGARLLARALQRGPLVIADGDLDHVAHLPMRRTVVL